MSRSKLKAVVKPSVKTELIPIDSTIAIAVEMGMKEINTLQERLKELIQTTRQLDAEISRKQNMTVGMLQSELVRAGIKNHDGYEYNIEKQVFEKVK
jgi:hypothetical protein